MSSQHLMLAARRGDRAAAEARFAEVLTESSGSDCGDELVAAVDAVLTAGSDVTDVLTRFEEATFDQLPADHVTAARMIIAGAQVDHAAVLAAFDDTSLERMKGIPAPLRASLHLVRARAYAAHSRTAEAREQAEKARSRLERWPGWRRDQVDALLQRLDAAEASDGELTPREREVAALLAEGLSNSEVRAAALHLSTHRRGARLQHPHEARDVEPHGSRRMGGPQRPDRGLTLSTGSGTDWVVRIRVRVRVRVRWRRRWADNHVDHRVGDSLSGVPGQVEGGDAIGAGGCCDRDGRGLVGNAVASCGVALRR